MTDKIPRTIRWITLPSGRTIPVTTYLDDHVKPGLHICKGCGSKFVQVAECGKLPIGTEWYLLLICPDCSYERGGSFSQAEVDALDEVLDGGLEAIQKDLHRLAQADAEDMADDIERFVAALHAGHLLPEVF